MAPHGVTAKSSYKYLEAITDGFSKENLIGKFQFGKVYRGKLNSDDGPRYCTVKIWEIPEIYRYNDGDNEDRLRDELSLLEHEKFNFHPGLVKLYGYCRDGEKLGIIYDLKPLDTVHHLVLKDSFTWVQRIKVALRFAGLLKFFHGQNPICRQFMVRNISAAHIMLDEDYNPKLFDFGMISGGIFPDRTLPPVDPVFGCYGYISPVFGFAGWCAACDTFAFGVLLLMLISKRVFDEDRDDDGSEVHQWATAEYNSKNTTTGFGQLGCSLVHKSLEEEPVYCSRDGRHITKLAMQCLEPYIWDRPTMKQVVKCLQNLRVVPRHALTPM